jgi:hypothetical protein
VLEHDYQLSFTDRRDAIYTKDMLIDRPSVNTEGSPQRVTPGMFDRAIPDMEDPR